MNSRSILFAVLLASLSEIQTFPVLAQIVPDATLGESNSLVTSDIEVRGELANLIEGGAVRGGNLFHSFSEFNISATGRVYFANPAGIEAILSRVTGNNPSTILGLLGVDGSADLYLLNPNGIVFGPEASLDVSGSFFATTAEAIEIGDGVFHAVEPEQSQLLAVDPNAVFWSYLTNNSGDVINRGQLAAGGDLVLAGNSLDLQGQIGAAGDMSLLAVDTVQVRDAATVPFIALARDELLVQGNQLVDIVALGHPDSGLFSYGNMVLRSANPVIGDAHYFSGGNFRLEQLDRTLGNLVSPKDPIIRSQGDVSIFAYRGASLHILAGGSIDINAVIITGPDTTGEAISPLTTPELANVALSDGTSLVIDGTSQPVIDVRAGVNLEKIIPPLGTSSIVNGAFFDSSLFPTEAPINKFIATSADIIVGDLVIDSPGGVVLLTNQYEPNSLDGDITVSGLGVLGLGIDARGLGEQGGAVYLDARNNITINESYINTSGAGSVGDIVLIASETITLDGTDGSRLTGAFSNLESGEQGIGGDIRVTAGNLQVLNGAQLNSLVQGDGQGGDVILNIREVARFEGSNPITGRSSGSFTDIQFGGEGQGGDIWIVARDLEILNGANLGAATFGIGNAGNIILDAEESVRFDGVNPVSSRPSAAFSSVEAGGEGRGGEIRIISEHLEVLGGAFLSTATFGRGDSGDVVLQIEDTAQFEGDFGGVYSNIQRSAEGTAGDIRIAAQNLEVLNGAQFSASTLGRGVAGNIILEISETARFDGANSINAFPSGAFSTIQADGEGRGGGVRILAGNLEVLNGAQISTSTLGRGIAGSVVLEISETARFDGVNPFNPIIASGAFSSIAVNDEGQGAGKGGEVRVVAENLEVLNGANLSASTFGVGDAGSVILEISETARFEGTNPIFGRASGVFSIVEPDARGQGGDIRINSNNLLINDGAGVAASSLGQGNAGDIELNIRNQLRATNGSIATNADFSAGGQIQITADNIFLFEDSDIQTFVNSGVNDSGNITISANTLVALDDSDILAFAADGRGGDVDLSRTSFFGQNFELAPSGTDPRTLDGNGRVDVNATGQLASGTITIPDVSFIDNSLTELPEGLIDTDILVATSCIATTSPSTGSFVITGSGGLPERPGEAGVAILTTNTVRNITTPAADATTAQNWQIGDPITEPQRVYQLADGRMVLGRACL